MALFGSLVDYADEIPHWHSVRVSKPDLHYMIEKAVDWMSLDSNPGLFAHKVEYVPQQTGPDQVVWCVFLSHPDVAFEFRLRFG
ncbi:MAG: hypothetical protein EOP83_02085 [Verrucomicrobiaceae bacterium]|nr:MAG: hypothetical protein EOP83_02085 [Verrucomicrobiaceae bacterium]